MDILQSLFDRYENDNFMIQKLNTIIEALPEQLENISKNKDLRDEISKQKKQAQDEFIDNFLSNQAYLYIPQTEIFINYNGKNYSLISEDEITHSVLTSLAKHNILSKLKYRIKIQIFKRIKENTLWNTIPESETVQQIIGILVPKLFSSKNAAKYFLTILGDGILNKKTDSLIHFLDPLYKNLLTTIAYQTYLLTGKSIGDSIKYKYYDHDYKYCRIIISKKNKNEVKLVENFIRRNTLDLISVCVYYSNRYKNSEGYLTACPNHSLVNSIKFLEKLNPDSLVDFFMTSHTKKGENDISFKNLYFLWRQFLNTNYLPFVISQNNFKQILSNKSILDSGNEICLKTESKYPMYWVSFLKFWDETIMTSEKIEDNYKLSEIVTIYNDWCNSKKNYIDEEKLEELIQFELPNIQIDKNKIIYHIKCGLWNKQKIIHESLIDIKKNNIEKRDIVELYKYYCSYVATHYRGKYIVTKIYFDEYIESLLEI